MATCALHFFLLSISLFSLNCLSASDEPKPKPVGPFTLPIKKDSATNQYYTSIGIGTPRHNMNLVIDLAGQSLWYDCNSSYNSSSYHPVSCGSKNCPRSSVCIGCYSFPFKPGCTNNTCGLDIKNPFADIIFSGDMGEDVLYLSQTKEPRFISGCADSDRFTDNILVGLAKATKGMLGFARSQISLPTQLSLAHKLPRKFALCLPSSDGTGNIYIGGGTPDPPTHLASIPFVVSKGDSSDEYFINVKKISIDDKVVNFNTSLLSIDEKGNGGVKISTMKPYTVLHDSIYKPFVRDFVKKASDRKIKRVASVPPFGACFDSNTISESDTGPAVPAINLILRDDGLYWGMYGSNLMVQVKKNVSCLAFVNGGKKATTSIVIGGHQLENYILEFDLDSSQLNYSSSLLLWDSTCSDLEF